MPIERRQALCGASNGYYSNRSSYNSITKGKTPNVCGTERKEYKQKNIITRELMINKSLVIIKGLPGIDILYIKMNNIPIIQYNLKNKRKYPFRGVSEDKTPLDNYFIAERERLKLIQTLSDIFIVEKEDQL